MPTRPPKYLRQRVRPPRSDKAFTIIDGKRHYLGLYGSEASYEKFGALLKGEQKTKPSPPPAHRPSTCSWRGS